MIKVHARDKKLKIVLKLKKLIRKSQKWKKLTGKLKKRINRWEKFTKLKAEKIN